MTSTGSSTPPIFRLDSTGSVEKKLTAQFEKAGKPIEALETIEQQLGYFDKLPEEQQRKMLTSVVEESDDAQQAFELLFNAWMTGDLEHIVTLSDTGIPRPANICWSRAISIGWSSWTNACNAPALL